MKTMKEKQHPDYLSQSRKEREERQECGGKDVNRRQL